MARKINQSRTSEMSILRVVAIIAFVGLHIGLIMSDALAQGQAHRDSQNYPSKPIRFVVPSTVGGGNDLLARLLSTHMSENWNRPVVVDNRPGAAGILGFETVANATPDGYTILIVAGGYTLNLSLYAKLPYDTLKDFERVSLIACAPLLLVVHSSVPVHSVRELISFAKAKPKYLNYASSGVGTTSYLSAAVFRQMSGADMVHIPYKGGGASTAAVIAGQVHLIFGAPNALIAHAKSGRVRSLGVTSAKRLSAIPQVPTIAETGLVDYEVNNCFGVLTPAKTPKLIVEKLNGEIVRILRLPAVREHLESLGFEVVGTTPEEFTAFAKKDIEKWAKKLKDAGIKPE